MPASSRPAPCGYAGATERNLYGAGVKAGRSRSQRFRWSSLGTLNYKVLGWPIGFGDKAKAAEMLNKSLAINPDGIDPNFFRGEYLFERERYGEALKSQETALKAPALVANWLTAAATRKYWP